MGKNLHFGGRCTCPQIPSLPFISQVTQGGSYDHLESVSQSPISNETPMNGVSIKAANCFSARSTVCRFLYCKHSQNSLLYSWQQLHEMDKVFLIFWMRKCSDLPNARYWWGMELELRQVCGIFQRRLPEAFCIVLPSCQGFLSAQPQSPWIFLTHLWLQELSCHLQYHSEMPRESPVLNGLHTFPTPLFPNCCFL